MEFRDRLIAPCGTYHHETDDVRVDAGALVRRLLLFERFTLRSTRLKELPHLALLLGYDGLKLLLDEGALDIHCDAVTMASVGEATELQSRAAKGALPPLSYSFAAVRPSNRREYISGCLADLGDWRGLGEKQRRKLKQLVARRLVEMADDGTLATHQLDADLGASAPVVTDAVSMALKREFNVRLEPGALDLRVIRIDAQDVRVETNLGELIGLELAHKAVERGILGLGGLNLRLGLMRELNALSGVYDGELPIFSSKVEFLTRELDPEVQEHRFDRIIELADLPAPGAFEPGAIDVERLLEIRESEQCRRLRDWLRTTDALSDAEIEELFTPVRHAVARAVRNPVGRAVRFAIGTGLGFIPVVGTAASIAVGALDEFLLERVLREPGPYSFLGADYPSIFGGS